MLRVPVLHQDGTPRRLREVFQLGIPALWKNVYYYIYRKHPLQITIAELAKALGNNDREIKQAITGLINHRLITKTAAKHSDGSIYKLT